MAFTQTKGRYATFGIVTSLPGEVIDSFWYFIDQYLKHVIPLKHILHFKLQNKKGKLSLSFSQEKYPNSITVDFPYKFDPFYNKGTLIIKRKTEIGTVDFESYFQTVEPIILKLRRHYFVKLWDYDDWIQEGRIVFFKLLQEQPEVLINEGRRYTYFKT